MPRIRSLLAAIAITLTAIGGAQADEGGRYQIVKSTEATAWRLDTVTGEIVACRFEGDAMLCGSTETAVTREKTTMKEYKAEKTAERKAIREEELAFMERVIEMFKSVVGFFMEQERARDQTATTVSADCDCKCP